jgi:hypothetical protein
VLTKDRGSDPGLDSHQRNADRGAHVEAEVPDRPVSADLRKFLEGVQGRLPFGYGEFRQVGVVTDDDRAFRLTRRPCSEQLGDLLLVVRRAGPVTVTRGVDDGDVEAAAGHEALCSAGHGRVFLVVAAAVAHQDQGCVIGGAGGRRPEDAGDVAHAEVALDHTVRRRLGSELQRLHRCCLSGVPFVEALPAIPTSIARRDGKGEHPHHWSVHWVSPP